MGQYFMPVVSRSDHRDNFVDEMVGTIYSHDHDNGLKIMEHSYIGNVLPEAIMAVLAKEPGRVVWAGDYADQEPSGELIYGLADKLPRIEPSDERYRYLINLERGKFIDLGAVSDIPDEAGWKIHPLPIITSEGNGRGGGDFRGSNVLVGAWARDLLSATNEKPEGFEEVRPNFVEG